MPSGFLHGVVRERLTAEDVADAVGAFPLTGGNGVEILGGRRGGTAIAYRGGGVQVVDIRPAVLTNTGPKGEADFDNELYWVQVWRPDKGNQKDPIVIQPDRANYAEDWWVPATNLPEWDAAGGTHLLPTDGTALVVLIRLVDRGGMERFVFSQSPPATGIKFGKLAASWPAHADHNLVDLSPCRSSSDATTLTDADGNPLPDITAYVQTPLGSTPAFFAVNSGEVVAYFTDTDGNNILIHAPVPGSNALYDLPQITSIVGGLGVGGCGPLRAQ